MIRYFIFIISFICIIYTSKADIKTAGLKIYHDDFPPTVVNRELTGGFLEFLYHYINDPKGIYAQEFLDRGFDWKNKSWNSSIKWDVLGRDDNAAISLKKGGYNKRGEYFIQIDNLSEQFQGLEQEVFLNDSISHDFYIYAKSPVNSDLCIQLIKNSEIVYSHDFGAVSEQWQKYSIEIPPLKEAHKVRFQIGNTNGKLHIDEASLIPSNNVNGLRHEFYEMFKYWHPGMLRYPGGCFADSPDVLLESCIGELDQRVSPLVVWPPASQRMDWGAYEFLTFCEELDIEPHITVNYVHGTPQEAADWVEYCNADTNTYYGKIRQEHGHPKPFSVKYFEIGNEQWENQEKYAHDYLKFYDAMKAVDPDINILIDGNHWNGAADIQKLYGIVGRKNQLYGYHPAFRGKYDFTKDNDIVFKSLLAAPHSHELYEIERMINEIKRMDLYPEVKLSASEWWLDYATNLDWTLDTNIRNASLESGLFCAGFTNALIRKARYVKTAARTFGMGMNRCYIKEDGRRYFTALPTLEAMSMLSNHTGDSLIVSSAEGEMYGIEELWFWGVPYLDAHVTKDKDSIYITLLNRYQYDTLEVTLKDLIIFKDAEGTHYQLWSENALDAVDAVNRYSMPYKTLDYNFNKSLQILPHSFNIFAFSLEDIMLLKRQSVSHMPYKLMGNVVSQKTELYVKDGSSGSYALYDALGHIIVRKEIKQETYFLIDMVNLSIGAYFIKIDLNGQSNTEKIIKIN